MGIVKMHAQLFLDPRIRDYVFVPLVFLMFNMQMLRIMAMRWMNEPKNKLLNPAKLAYATLFGTIFEKDADRERQLPDEQLDIPKLIESGTEVDHRETQALARSKKIRTKYEYMTERAVRTRKAYYTNEANGWLTTREMGAANPMNMMANPDMMNNMMKQNIQSVIYMFMFTGIGSVFQGFVTAQIPFPLGYKFKQMVQALDPTYVSSMSWAFLLVYGLNGIMALILADQKTIEEMELMASGAGMMQQQNQMQAKNYKALFKTEAESYTIINYQSKLDDIEEAFVLQHRARKMAG